MGNHRADRRSPAATSATPHELGQVASAAAPVTAGKRRASAPARPRLRLASAAPIVAGVAALAVSAGGAVQAGLDPAPASDSSAVSAAPELRPVSALSGVSQVSSESVLKLRERAVSRDSARDTLQDSAQEEQLQVVEAQAQERNATMAKFAKQVEAQSAKIRENAWVLPVANYRLSATFGQSSYLWSRNHTGLDFAAPYGTPILAVAGGVVTSVGYDGSYGNKVVVALDDGTEVWYAHMSAFAVSVGESVRAGEQLGSVGSTGNSTGNHLHLEVRPGAGDPVDPYQALIVHGITP